MFAPEAEYERHGDVQDVVFPCGIYRGNDGEPSISTMVPPLSIAWRTAVFRSLLAWLARTAIRNKLTIEWQRQS